ncbi:type I restriction-modification system subunit M [Pseudomonas putida]|uniref:type I restriction-modification system subunit M n=1 Tax=Pseudomonas putida TaxID=303 RepID=UPI00345D94D8
MLINYLKVLAVNKQQLAAKIWESANQMRSKIEANEYKDYILGFIFYKYLSDKLLAFASAEGFTDEDFSAVTEEDTETVDHFKSNLGYFIAHKHLFSTWLKQTSDFDVADVREALSAFGRLIHPNHKRLFDGIFKTLETGLSKLGDTAAKQTKAISELVQLIKDIPMDGKQGYDVLGFIYEYLIGMFAANAGKKAGEFYTPHEVSVLMSEVIAHHLRDRQTIQIYDSTSGSGSLLLNIGQAIGKHMGDKGSIKYYAQELKENTYNLTRMNLVMRGILPGNIVTRNADTLEDDWPYFDEQDPVNSYNPLYLDAVVSNPPYSQKWDPLHKDADPRYARFGVAPKSKADYAFLLHDLYHLKPNGIMAIVLPHGVLFRGGEEGVIRKQLIENDHLETIIGLPSNIFFGTGIPTVILVLRQRRESSDVLFVDASKGFAKEGKNNKLRACDIKKITDVVIARDTVPSFSRLVPKTELQGKTNDYNLNIPRYVDSSEPPESWDLYASMFGGIPLSELDALSGFWKAFPNLRAALFTLDGTPYAQPKSDDLAEAVHQHPEITKFSQAFTSAFDGFKQWLHAELIGKMLTLQVPRQEALICDELFARLAKVSEVTLIDKYQAYQVLDDHWQPIAVDLEILQTEGFGATRVVDPNYVVKKKDGKDVEVQDGWKGRILPFDLVQLEHHKNELDALCKKESELAEVVAQLEDLLEGFSDEDKAKDTFNESGDKFVAAAVTKEAKELAAEANVSGSFGPDSYEAKIIQAAEALAKEKSLKAAIKKGTAALHLKTKATIEALSDAQAYTLLESKWLSPLVDEVHSLPGMVTTSLIGKLEALIAKYQITYADNARDIQQAEDALVSMLGELDGGEFDLKGIEELKTLLAGN